MSYRIQVGDEARSVLCNLAPHIVQRLGRALAALAEALGAGEMAEGTGLDLPECALELDIDHEQRLLRVLRVIPLAQPAPAPA